MQTSCDTCAYFMYDDEYEEYFYTEMKKDFQKMIGHERYDEFMKNTYTPNKKRFNIVIESKDFEDFKVKHEALELEIENNKLKKELKQVEAKNNTIVNSTSWKITKPLRAFKKIFK